MVYLLAVLLGVAMDMLHCNFITLRELRAAAAA